MAERGVERKLAAILDADVVGYSRLMEVDEEGTHARLKAHREELIDPTVDRHNGHIVKLTGDGALVEFPSVVEAVQCAVDIQRGMAERNADVMDDQRIVFRMGVNLGDVIVEGEDIYGGGVNVAARLEGLADPGGILISGTTYDQVEGRLDCGLEFVGEQQVKNIERPVRVYRVLLDGVAATSAKAMPARRARWRRWPAAAVGVALLIVLGVVGWLRPWEITDNAIEEVVPSAATLDTRRIAVLPFANMSPDAENEYFADGITEELTTRIAQIGELSVIARTSVMKFKDTEKSVAEIGRALNVGTILEGSVRRAGDQVRITAQLIDVGSEAHLWADNYERDLADVFAIQSAVAQEVARSLQIQLLADEKEQITATSTTDVEAYKLYLRAKHLWDHSSDIVKALDLLKEAVERDPDFAAAHADIADLSLSLANYTNTSFEEAAEQARKHATIALALNDKLADAHFAMGRLKMTVDWDWDGAEASFQRALEINPNLSRARMYYGQHFLVALRRRDDQALEQVSNALARDPLSLDSMHAMGWVRYHRREYDAAITVTRDSLELYPEEPWTYVCLGMSLVRKGQYDEGIAEIRKAVEIAPDSGWMRAHLGWAYGMSGRVEEAREVVDQLEEQAQEGSVPPMAFALPLASLGEKEAAIDWIEKAYAERDGLITWLRIPDLADFLSGEPRYQALLQELGLEN